MSSVGISTEVVAALLNQGFTQSEIADLLHTTRQVINYHAKKIGWKDPSKQVTELLPWQDLTPNERKATPYVMLHNHVEYMIFGTKTMSDNSISRLRSWYKTRIQEYDVVVEYDPNIPPSPNQKFGGWRYVPRTAEDGDLIIRRNKYTKLSETQEALFKLPTELP